MCVHYSKTAKSSLRKDTIKHMLTIVLNLIIMEVISHLNNSAYITVCIIIFICIECIIVTWRARVRSPK